MCHRYKRAMSSDHRADISLTEIYWISSRSEKWFFLISRGKEKKKNANEGIRMLWIQQAGANDSPKFLYVFIVSISCRCTRN